MARVKGKITKKQIRVLEFLKASEDVQGPSAIGKALGYPEKSGSAAVMSLLKNLVSLGYAQAVIPEGRKRASGYVITGAGEDFFAQQSIPELYGVPESLSNI